MLSGSSRDSIMRIRKKNFRRQTSRAAGFTLAEVVISITVLAVVIQGVILGYVTASRHAEWSAHSLAAESLALQGAEQARSAKWDSQAWPQLVGPGRSDELGVTNYARIVTLDVPANGQPIMATNFISVTAVSANPPVRQIQSDCVWRFLNGSLFTNTVVTLRGSDQ
jgi:prepilin-type N-terminal cleavage/methylation domain-containing protein